MKNDGQLAPQLTFDLEFSFPESCLKVKPNIEMHLNALVLFMIKTPELSKAVKHLTPLKQTFLVSHVKGSR